MGTTTHRAATLTRARPRRDGHADEDRGVGFLVAVLGDGTGRDPHGRRRFGRRENREQTSVGLRLVVPLLILLAVVVCLFAWYTELPWFVQLPWYKQ